MAAGKGLAQRHMVDTIAITRPGTSTFDEVTGAYTASTTSVYTGLGRILPPTLAQPVAGEAEVERHDALCWVPLNTPAVRRGDILSVSEAARDTQLTGRTYRVVAVDSHSFPARRVLMLEGL